MGRRIKLLLKNSELWIRRNYIRRKWANGNAKLVSVPATEAPVSDPCNILMLRQDRIGDVLVSVPIIRLLRNAFPSSTITMVLSSNNHSARMAVDPYVNNVIVYRKGLAGILALRSRLRKSKYDVAIDLTDNASSISGLILQFAAATYSIGIDKENRGAYTHVVPPADRASVHIVERIARLLWPLGIDSLAQDLRLSFPLSTLDRLSARGRVRNASQYRKVFGINISGSEESRMHSETALIEIARWCVHEFPSVETVLMGAPQHSEMLARIQSATGCRSIPVSSSFAEWAANISELDALLTPDTSTVHLASAFQIPSVVLYVHFRQDLLPWYPYKTDCFPVKTLTGPISSIPVHEIENAIRKCLQTLNVSVS